MISGPWPVFVEQKTGASNACPLAGFCWPSCEEKQMEYIKVFSAVPMLMPMLTTESLGKMDNSGR